MTVTTVSSGQTSSGLTVSSGDMLDVLSGGTVVSTTVLSGGVDNVFAGGLASATVLLSGGTEILSGGTASGTVLSAGSGSLSTTEVVSSGGVAISTTASGGQIMVASGGETVSAVLTVPGVAGGSTASEIVSAGGLAISTIMAQPTFLDVFGTASGTQIGGFSRQNVESGGIAIATTVSGGDALASVLAGGLDLATTLTDFGLEQVAGTASGTVIEGSGEQTVVSGGVAIRSTISSTGTEKVFSGGITSDTTIAGGTLDLISGDAATGAVTFSSSGGVLEIDSKVMPTATISGFTPEDKIDLTKVPFSPTNTVMMTSGGVLQISDGTVTYDLNFSTAQSYGPFRLAADTGSGTLVEETTGPRFPSAAYTLSYFGTQAGGWTTQNQYPRALGDVNGDGKSDIVGFASNGVQVSLATGGGSFAAPATVLAYFGTQAGGWTSQNQYPRVLGDVNGDGKSDIVGFASDGVQVSLATGGGNFSAPSLILPDFGTQAGGWTSQNQYPRLLADINGDGKADIVGFASDGVHVALATGGGNFTDPGLVLPDFGTNAGGWTSQDQYPRFLADVNGDGMADIVGFASDGVHVALATGGGHFASATLEAANFGTNAGGWSSQNLYPRLLGDVSDDGLADIVGFGSPGVDVALAHNV